MLSASLLISREVDLPSLCTGGLSGTGDLNYPLTQSLPWIYIISAVVSLMHWPCSPLTETAQSAQCCAVAEGTQGWLISASTGIRLVRRETVAQLSVPQLLLKII